jgi:signal transduction histidine kinase
VRSRLSTVRVRLTALYGGLFIATTTALLVTVNLLLQHLLDRRIAMVKYERATGPDYPTDFIPKSISPKRPAMEIIERDIAASVAKDLRVTVLDYQWGVTWIAVALLAVIGVATGWWLAGRVLRPLHRITATAQRLSLSNLHERIALTGPRDELKELADTFDAMFERLERAADGQRRFAANASHELRTPLAIQRAAIEIGLDDPSPDELVRMREELLQANLRTERLIDGLMMLAQGERGLDGREAISLDVLAEEVADHHRDAAAAADVALDLELEPVTVTGDPVLLARLVDNLVHNAIRHNHPGGRLRVHTSPASGLTVSNTGPEIPADRVSELFEPFRRLHPPRTGPSEGAGLGLSIVAAIADAHDAHLTARPNPGGGLTVSVAPPALSPVPAGQNGRSAQ